MVIREKIVILEAIYGMYKDECTTSYCLPNLKTDCRRTMRESSGNEWAKLEYECSNMTSCSFCFHEADIEPCHPVLWSDQHLDSADYLEIHYDCIPHSRNTSVAFSASFNRTYNIEVGSPVTFPNISLNIGGHFSRDVSAFVVPYHGLYMLALNQQSVIGLSVEVNVNKAVVLVTAEQARMFVLELDAGDRVWLEVASVSSSSASSGSLFELDYRGRYRQISWPLSTESVEFSGVLITNYEI